MQAGCIEPLRFISARSEKVISYKPKPFPYRNAIQNTSALSRVVICAAGTGMPTPT